MDYHDPSLLQIPHTTLHITKHTPVNPNVLPQLQTGWQLTLAVSSTFSYWFHTTYFTSDIYLPREQTIHEYPPPN